MSIYLEESMAMDFFINILKSFKSQVKSTFHLSAKAFANKANIIPDFFPSLYLARSLGRHNFYKNRFVLCLLF